MDKYTHELGMSIVKRGTNGVYTQDEVMEIALESFSLGKKAIAEQMKEGLGKLEELNKKMAGGWLK